MKKILLGLLGAKGDCVYGTTLAHQIRHDNPDCHLVWAVSSGARDVLRNNPHIDEIWEIPGNAHGDAARNWPRLAAEAKELVCRGHLDAAYLAQISPDNYQNYDGTIRPSVFRAYNKPVTVPVRGHVVLEDEEKEAVRDFVRDNSVTEFRHRVLFECTGKSGQSKMTVEHAVEAASLVLQELPDTCFLISTDSLAPDLTGNIIPANAVSFRENLELVKYCSLFVGCGSGITALISTCSDAFATVPALQVLAGGTSVYASFAHDFAYWGLDASPFHEMRDPTPEETALAVTAFLKGDPASAAHLFKPDDAPFFSYYLKVVENNLLGRGRIVDAAYSLSHVVKRYGWHRDLLPLGIFIFENIENDAQLTMRAHAEFIKSFRKDLAAGLKALRVK